MGSKGTFGQAEGELARGGMMKICRGKFPFEAKILPELQGDEQAARLAVLQGEPVVENTPLLHHLGHMVQTYKIVTGKDLVSKAALWNCNYFLRFRLRFRLAPYLDHKSKFFKNNVGNFFVFLLSKLFYKEKVYKFQQIFGKM
jgi:hypothetical protein